VTELERALDEVTEHLAETMFFTTVLNRTGELGGQPGYTASIAFSGTRAGALRVALPHSTAAALAVSFLGEADEEEPDARARALAGELANILCGSLLGRMEPAGHFTISPPEVTAGTEAPGQPADARRVFTLEEGPLAIAAVWSSQ
jgi:CheY-specific phosphatase CheX